MLGKLAIIAALLALPQIGSAQFNSAPSYTFGGSGPTGFPGLFGGFPGAYPNNIQNQFMTMPQYGAAPQYGVTPAPQGSSTQPTPQFFTPYAPPQAGYPSPITIPVTPAPTATVPPSYSQPNYGNQQAQAPARFITEIPRHIPVQPAPQNQYPAAGGNTPPAYAGGGYSNVQNSPPRWAPLGWQPTIPNFAPRGAVNNWMIPPVFQSSPVTAPPVASTPPRWPSQ